MYEVIVLGATFAAAGIAHKYKEKCLVIERRAQAGYEFCGEHPFDTPIYPYLKECHTDFCVEIGAVEKTDGGFLCVTHGVDGFRSYTAKKVVDTRCNAEMAISKTYNLLIESEETPCFSNTACEKTGTENRYVIRCAVPLFCGYAEARSIAQKVIQCFSESQRLILLADEFDYQVKEGYPKMQEGILYLPSKAYKNPSLAFEAGLAVGEVLDK